MTEKCMSECPRFIECFHSNRFTFLEPICLLSNCENCEKPDEACETCMEGSYETE
jgi:hypothetical protein